MRPPADLALAPAAVTGGGVAPVGRPDVPFGTAVRWSYLLMTGGNVLNAFLTFVIAAILSPRDFGVITTAMVWVALAMVLLEHGPTIAVVQQDDITPDHVNAAFWATVAAATGYGLLLAAFAPAWAAINDLSELLPICLALAPLPLLQALNVIAEAVLRRHLRMRSLAVRVLVANLIAGAAGIAAALAGFGVWALVVQQLAWPLLYGVLLWRIAGWRPRVGPLRKPLRDIRRTSLQTYAGAVGSHLSSRTDVILMGALFGPVVVGLYFFAARFAETAGEFASGGLRLVSLPHLSRHSQEAEAMSTEVRRILHGIALLTFPALGIVAGIAAPLLLALGDQWAAGTGALVVLCVTAAVTTTVTILGASLQARARAGIPAAFTWVTMGGVAVAILLSAWLSAGSTIPVRLMAVATGVVVVQALVMAVLLYVLLRRVLGVPVWSTVAAMAPGTGAAVLAAAAGTLTHRLSPVDNRLVDLVFSGAVAGITAVAALLLLDRRARSLAGHAVTVLRHQRATPPPTR
jgi:PST family polysaccharide transporter